MPSPTHARRRALIVALLVFAAVAGVGVARHHPPALAVPAERAAREGAHEQHIRTLVAHRADRSIVTRVDDHLVRVTYFDGGQAIATVGVRPDGELMEGSDLSHLANGYGAPLSHLPALLVGFTALFLLAVLRGRLLSTRTLDAIALAAFVVPTVLLDHGLLAVGQASAAALLAYIAIRGVLLAVRGPAASDRDDAPVLLERLAQRHRAPSVPVLLGLSLIAVVVATTLTSTGEVDVSWASMEGATTLLHGQLPYGHLPGDIVHGDTYGLPMYLMYVPVAVLWPVGFAWDEVTGALVVSALCAVLCAVGLARVSARRPGTPWPAIVAMLAFAPGLIGWTSGTNDVLIAVAMVWALAWWTRPRASAIVLTAAGLAKVAPLILLPLWLARLRGRALVAAATASTAVGAATLALLVALGGLHGPLDMAHAMGFQLSRESVASVWTMLGLERWQPVAQAGALAIALGGAVLVWGDRALAADPRRVAGLIAAVLAALQLAASHWAPLYLLWLLPPATVALLGPLGARARAAVPVAAAAPVPAH